MKKKTLVIHPEDPSTDFLIDIYRGRGFTEIRKNFNPEHLKVLIEEHDRIVLLGHGFHHGLLHYTKTIIDESYVPLLRNKELVGIWCYAKTFFSRHELPGFYTDMFISEMAEAEVMGVDSTQKAIDVSNRLFATLVRKNLFHDHAYDRILSGYKTLRTPVAVYNQSRLNHRSKEGVLQGCENHTPMDLLSKFVMQNPEIITRLLSANQSLFQSMNPNEETF